MNISNDITIVERNAPAKAHRVDLDHNSVLDNPYSKSGGMPAKLSTAMYRKWLWRQIATGNSAVIEALEYIQNTLAHEGAVELVCHRVHYHGNADPEPCHADVVKAAVIWAIEENGCSFKVAA